MNTILCFLAFSLIGWVCLSVGLARSRRFRARSAARTGRAEGVIRGYEVIEKPWGRGPAAKCCHPVVAFSVDGHPYTATADFRRVGSREKAPARLPQGSRAGSLYSPSDPFRFRLEREADDRGMARIGVFRVAVASIACAPVFRCRIAPSAEAAPGIHISSSQCSNSSFTVR